MQLQVAYHHLFQEYDAHIKASMEGDKRSQVRSGGGPLPPHFGSLSSRFGSLQGSSAPFGVPTPSLGHSGGPQPHFGSFHWSPTPILGPSRGSQPHLGSPTPILGHSRGPRPHLGSPTPF